MNMEKKQKDNETRIVVVEDSPTQAIKLQFLLEEQGYEVILAVNGKEGIEAVQEQSPDLIISDIVMPVMDGYEMCYAIKQKAEFKDIPVILLTSLSELEDIIKGLEARADYYLTKPYDSEHLVTRVKSILATPFQVSPEETQEGLEVIFAGQSYVITSGRQQMLNLLLSTYDNAVQQNNQLINAQNELKKMNTDLQQELIERKRAEEALKRSEEKYRLLSEQLAEANDMKELLLDVITHDLKNPAGVINGMSEITLEENPDDEVARMIKDSSDNLLEVVQNATTLAQVTLNEDIEKDELDLTEIIEKLKIEFQLSLQTSGLSLEFQLDDSLAVRANPILAEIFKNYISNAIKYASEGKKIIVKSQKDDLNVYIKVIDFGKTISEAERERIFERKTQLEEGKKRGRGLGLAIVKRIALAHGGEVWVEPNKPNGNIFCFRIARRI